MANARQRQQHKRHRVQEEIAAEHGLVDGDALICRVHVGLVHERELAAQRRRLEQVRVQAERDAVGVEPAMRHVVGGEVVVRAEVERTAEAR